METQPLNQLNKTKPKEPDGNGNPTTKRWVHTREFHTRSGIHALNLVFWSHWKWINERIACGYADWPCLLFWPEHQKVPCPSPSFVVWSPVWIAPGSPRGANANPNNKLPKGYLKGSAPVQRYGVLQVKDSWCTPNGGADHLAGSGARKLAQAVSPLENKVVSWAMINPRRQQKRV